MTCGRKLPDGSLSGCGGSGVVAVRSRRSRWVGAQPCPRCIPDGRCEECKGSGSIFEDGPDGLLYSRPCSCTGVWDRVKALQRVRLPARYATASLTAYEAGALVDGQPQRAFTSRETAFSERSPHIHRAMHDESLQGLLDAIDSAGWDAFRPGDPGYGLSGPVGTGMTHVLCALMRMLAVEQGIRCAFVEFDELLSQLRHCYEKNEPTEPIVRLYTSVPVLTIDELGSKLATEWQAGVLSEILGTRYNDPGLTTCFTTNMHFEQPERAGKSEMRVGLLRDRIGERLYSRLHEMAEFRRVAGTDWRKNEGAVSARE